MAVLKHELHEFNPNFFGTYSELRECAAAGGQELLLVACSDHSAAPDNLSIAENGQLVIVQNLAASIPNKGHLYGLTTIGSIEYAVDLMNVKHAIICGHLGCTIVTHWLKSQPDEMDSGEAREFHRQAKSTVDVEYSKLSPGERLRTVIEEHTIFQVANLQSHQFVRSRLDTAMLRFHAWVVDDETARVTAYDPRDGQFHPLGLTHA